MKISYAISVCNEFIEIQRLLTFLLEHKRPQDEIVVLVDLTKNEPTSELLDQIYTEVGDSIERVFLLNKTINGMNKTGKTPDKPTTKKKFG
jgi:hypothetical protein